MTGSYSGLLGTIGPRGFFGKLHIGSIGCLASLWDVAQNQSFWYSDNNMRNLGSAQKQQPSETRAGTAHIVMDLYVNLKTVRTTLERSGP